jgi:hypothetical protein
VKTEMATDYNLIWPVSPFKKKLRIGSAPRNLAIEISVRLNLRSLSFRGNFVAFAALECSFLNLYSIFCSLRTKHEFQY